MNAWMSFSFLGEKTFNSVEKKYTELVILNIFTLNLTILGAMWGFVSCLRTFHLTEGLQIKPITSEVIGLICRCTEMQRYNQTVRIIILMCHSSALLSPAEKRSQI